jgi:hypothetical protein
VQVGAGVSRRIVTREILNDWILNDGLEQLFMEGYLHPDSIDPEDPALLSAVKEAHGFWKAYENAAVRIQNLVDEVA